MYEKFGTPEWIRTTDLLLRRQTLYPAELRARMQTKALLNWILGLSHFDQIFKSLVSNPSTECLTLSGISWV